LDLSVYKGMIPTELAGHTAFPPVGDPAYFITLGPHAFYWFSLAPPAEGQSDVSSYPPRVLELPLEISDWKNLFRGNNGAGLKGAMAGYLQSRNWAGRRNQALNFVR